MAVSNQFGPVRGWLKSVAEAIFTPASACNSPAPDIAYLYPTRFERRRLGSTTDDSLWYYASVSNPSSIPSSLAVSLRLRMVDECDRLGVD